MDFVCDGVEPEDHDDFRRVVAAANFLEYRDGNLFIIMTRANVTGYVIVPPIRDRERIVAETALATGLMSGDKVYALLRERYFWRGMRNMCVKFCDGNIAC